MKTIIAITAASSLAGLSSFARPIPGTGDWPMWGGTPDRNMVSSMKGLPTTWDVKTKKNVKWVAELGSQAYGNPGRRRRHGASSARTTKGRAIRTSKGTRAS